MSDKIKLVDYLQSCQEIVEKTLIESQKELHRKFSPNMLSIFTDKFISKVKQENAKGNIYAPDFDIVRVIRAAISDVMELPRFKQPEVKVYGDEKRSTH